MGCNKAGVAWLRRLLVIWGGGQGDNSPNPLRAVGDVPGGWMGMELGMQGQAEEAVVRGLNSLEGLRGSRGQCGWSRRSQGRRGTQQRSFGGCRTQMLQVHLRFVPRV